MKVLSLNESKLRNDEAFSVSKQIQQVIAEKGPDGLQVSAEAAALDTALLNLSDRYLMERGQWETQEIVALDRVRDNYLRGMTQYVQSMTLHPDAAKASAANRILFKIDVYGSDLIRLNYGAQTVRTEELLADLQEDTELQPALAALPEMLGGWIPGIRQANKDFSIKYDERMDRRAALENMTVTSLRRAADAARKSLLEMLESQCRVNRNGELWVTTITKINEYIKAWNDLIARRPKRGKDEGNDESPQA